MATFIKIFLLLICCIIPAHAEVVAQLESNKETKEQFLVRVAEYMSKWTKKNGNEACGLIIKQGQQYAVVIETQNQHQSCNAGMSYVGWELTGENIHSHPRIKFGAGFKKRVHKFSETDYESPGYLVDNDQLWYQNGVNTDTLVAELIVKSQELPPK